MQGLLGSGIVDQNHLRLTPYTGSRDKFAAAELGRSARVRAVRLLCQRLTLRVSSAALALFSRARRVRRPGLTRSSPASRSCQGLVQRLFEGILNAPQGRNTRLWLRRVPPARRWQCTMLLARDARRLRAESASIAGSSPSGSLSLGLADLKPCARNPRAVPTASRLPGSPSEPVNTQREQSRGKLIRSPETPNFSVSSPTRASKAMPVRHGAIACVGDEGPGVERLAWPAPRRAHCPWIAPSFIGRAAKLFSYRSKCIRSSLATTTCCHRSGGGKADFGAPHHDRRLRGPCVGSTQVPPAQAAASS